MEKRRIVVTMAVLAALAVVAGAGYLTRDSWMHAVPFLHKEEGGFKIVEKGGVKYKECYTCTMHPSVIRPAPGDCPICGMALVKKLVPVTEEEQAAGAAAPAVPFDAEKAKADICYTCPMHPSVVKPAPEDCPICGMDLVRQEAEKEQAHEGHVPGMEMDEETKSLMRVRLDPRERVLANVATTRVGYKDLGRDVYTVGRVAYNEDTIRRVSAWFPGRVERGYVTYEGQYVARGQRVLSIYSPELVATEKEYLIAKRSAARLAESGFPEITEGTGRTVEAARQRMRLWGLTEAQIDRLDATGEVVYAADVYSPASGTVTGVKAREGDYVMEGSELFSVADLSVVWVNAEVYEYEFSKVGMGAHVEITADAYPGRAFHGRAVFIDPVVDPQSRTVRVRAEMPNKGGLLKPEMFVNARIISAPRRALVVPASAVLYTGRRDVVWVEVAPGEYEPRDVTLGLRSGDEYEVLSGLSEGEMAVSQGGFLIDSEAELRMSAGGGHAGMAGMEGMETGGEPEGGAPKEKAPAGGHAGH